MEQQPNVDKFVIHVFTDKSYKTEVNQSDPYRLPINPESFSKNYKVEYDLTKGQGNQGTKPEFKGTAPEEMKLEFTFDGTKTIMGNIYSEIKVSDQVKTFLNTVYYMDGEIHQPKFLKIAWGDNKPFECILTNLDINYTLFDRKGNPLRAKLSATFINFIEQEKRVRKENKNSPDLTHVRKVTEGDTLPLMTHRIYKDDSWYLQIAKANNLTSFRNLVPGQEIIFPPIEKTESNG